MSDYLYFSAVYHFFYLRHSRVQRAHFKPFVDAYYDAAVVRVYKAQDHLRAARVFLDYLLELGELLASEARGSRVGVRVPGLELLVRCSGFFYGGYVKGDELDLFFFLVELARKKQGVVA